MYKSRDGPCRVDSTRVASRSLSETLYACAAIESGHENHDAHEKNNVAA